MSPPETSEMQIMANHIRYFADRGLPDAQVVRELQVNRENLSDRARKEQQRRADLAARLSSIWDLTFKEKATPPRRYTFAPLK